MTRCAGVDYWALGVLLYEMVCGYSPFADMATNDQMKICKNILRGTVVYPSLCPPQVSPARAQPRVCVCVDTRATCGDRRVSSCAVAHSRS